MKKNCLEFSNYRFGKKFALFFMLVLSLIFSLSVFVACGNNYDDLKITAFSKQTGEEIDSLNFIIDASDNSFAEEIIFEFSGIDKKDVGQINVYSIPNELVTVSNYVYKDNQCTVLINPMMPTSGNAKLVVSHLASNKKKEFDLNIEQKSNDLQLLNSKYIISIPEDGEKEHVIDFSKLLKLLPIGSTDKIYFKVLRNPYNVELISAPDEASDLFCGFKINSSITESKDNDCIKIYPVTYMNGLVSEFTDEYIGKEISIYFKKILKPENVKLISEYLEEDNDEPIQLLANHNSLNSFKLTLGYNNKQMIETDFFDMYTVKVNESDNQKISSLVDSNNEITIMAQTHTEEVESVEIILEPFNYVGEIYPVKKIIKVQGQINADDIETTKNGKPIDLNENINIFDYYGEGNSLGSLFNFNPYSFSGVSVHESLNKMQIVVKADILSEDNCEETIDVKRKKYVLKLHIFNELLKFTSDGNGNMISAPIDSDDRIYIMYEKLDSEIESANFGLTVQTINNSNFENWKSLEPTEIDLNFNRLEGVKEVSVNVGYYQSLGDQNTGEYTPVGVDPENVYLNRLEGLDDGTSLVYFMQIVDESVKGIDGSTLPKADFEVEIKPLFVADNPLLICKNLATKDHMTDTKENGKNLIQYSYEINNKDLSVSFVFRSQTSIGQYEINFYQEGVVKFSTIITIYEDLEEVDKENVEIETNDRAFKNDLYGDIYKADYIVASGQELEININLDQDVINSGIIVGYAFSFKVGNEIEDTFVPIDVENNGKFADYFEIYHDHNIFNNATLKFLKGTFIGDEAKYVYLKVSVAVEVFETIVQQASEPKIIDTELKFYIYEEIQDEDISINYQSMEMFYDNYLGVYYKDKSQASLEISMDTDLWNYISVPKDFSEVQWMIDGDSAEDGLMFNFDFNEKTAYVKFLTADVNNCVRTVKAYVHQFNKIFELRCVFYVSKPVITERVTVNSEIYVKENKEQTCYIDLKEGETYSVVAKNNSSKGEVSHAETIIQVFDETGSAYSAKQYFDIDQSNGKITVKKVDELHKFKLIVFAKDALKYIPSADMSGYNTPSSFMLDFIGAEKGKYNKAFYVIEIELSNGTKENPYLIKNLKDFWEIDDSEVLKKSNYKLMTSLSLYNKNEVISGFAGTIVADNGNIFTIDNITLNNENKNLFVDFAGSIENLKFIVNYDYNLSNPYNLGLFDVNNGSLADVGVQVLGNANLNSPSDERNYFGCLVGKNYGSITYTKTFGVLGEIVLSGTKTYFGGLVGENFGDISGTEKFKNGGNNIIELNTETGRESALSQIRIISTLTENSSIGGVVGINNFDNAKNKLGTIKNAFILATIIAENTSNVGGVIGTNKQASSSLKLNAISSSVNSVYLPEDLKDKAIYNVKSASTIKAKDNVGGIVGYDINGIYFECDYQILSTTIKFPSIVAVNNAGGIAGRSDYGKFVFCSVMSYCWNYKTLQSDASQIIDDVADIQAMDYVGGIVGFAKSSTDLVSIQSSGTEIADRVIVLYSSVNAYLQATKQDNGGLVGNIGGILSSGRENNTTYKAIIFNAYFIGMIEGKLNYLNVYDSNMKMHYLCLDNNGSTAFNIVYTLNIESKNNSFNIRIGHLANGNALNISTNDDWKDQNFIHWWGNELINGGYLYITTDTNSENQNKLPIFDLTPDSIKVTVKEENRKAENLDQVLMLDYYDFSKNEGLSDDQMRKIDYAYNKETRILDLFNFEVDPRGLGVVALNAKSTNTNVVDVAFDGRLLINGIGKCELIFSSVLDPEAGKIEDRTIKIVVDYPIGETFAISTSKTDNNKVLSFDKTLEIAKDNSKQLYVLTQGSVSYDVDETGDKKEYRYKTKDDVHLKFEISYFTKVDVSKYVSISGLQGYQPEDSLTYTLKIDDKTPIIVSVLKKLEIGEFNIIVTPYNIVEDTEIPYLMEDENGKNQSLHTKFKLLTIEGVTNITFSYDDAIVYPNDTVYLTANIVTDDPFNKDNINKIYNYIKVISNNEYSFIKIDYNKYNIIKNGELIGTFNLDVEYFEHLTNNVQTIVFKIEFGDLQLTEETELKINATHVYDENEIILDQVEYLIIPQRINKIEIKNYYKKDDGEWVLDNILKPSNSEKNNTGKLIVDIAPNNGYYSYLEISDITGDEEILFIQVDENGNALSVNYDPSSDKKGIKLYYYDGQVPSRFYIYTQIDRNYSSKIHTIEIRAYSNNGTLLHSQRKLIDVKMLPEITVKYILPDGYTVGESIISDVKSQMKTLYLANGVDANFIVETKNANSDLEYTITAEKTDGTDNSDLANRYEFVNVVGNHYVLQRKADAIPSIDDLNKKIRVSFKTYAYLDNGDFELAECSIEFTIVKFVVHSVSVNNSIDNSNTQEIYGYVGKPVKLNFYFDEDDISYYDNDLNGEPFWDTVYEYSEGIENLYTNGSALNEIYTILKELNAYDDDYLIKQKNDYLVLNNNSEIHNGDHKYNDDIDPSKISLRYNELNVQNGYDKKLEEQNGKKVEVDDPKYLAVEFRLYKDKNTNNWSIDKYKPTVEADLSYEVAKNYKLNFKNATAWYEPTVVHNEEDFLKMTSGGRYILAKNLVLRDYVPIDANLIEFDGNGRTITIENFGLFNEVNIQAGLFKQIYPDMIVKNVVVKYESIELHGNWTFGNVDNTNITYSDLCNNPSVNYESINFGGLTAVNNGIITNCFVQGRIAIKASTIEQKKFASGADYAINFFIGGMVAENTTTGYITNSTAELSIYAQANIGGFVYKNNGKIASCGVEKSTIIYAYNTGLEKTIVVQVAGFVVNNDNYISMSYVNLQNQDNMSAKDISAGFVYSNSGSIIDAYVDISKTGLNNNTFAGFVYSNTGEISRAYSYINQGIRENSNDFMFATAGTTGLKNCIEFIVLKSGYENNVENGLTSLEIGVRYNKQYYQNQGFAFGDNKSAVWTIDVDEMPKLVSTKELVVYKGNLDYDGLLPLVENVETNEETGVDTISYKPNFAYYGTKENPYIISDLYSWKTYFENNTTSYFRIVKDIDFGSLGDNPNTSSITFKGNIQGNNMYLNNIMLYSTSTLNALGLFRDMQSANDSKIVNSVRNLTLKTTSVWASRTTAVGLLAGIIEDFNIYNITIDAENVIIVGGNAVGGLAGVVRGNFDIDQITTNVGANSTRASTQHNYSIYKSKNNKQGISANLSSVYYAGSVVGVLDGYTNSNFNINSKRDLTSKYLITRNIYVKGKISIIGDTVGGAFGFVGERVYLTNINANISGSLAGVQYSAGLVGENRGVIDNNNIAVILNDDMFKQSSHVSAGLVGFNLGGLVRNIKIQANIKKSGYGHIVGGVVGRNIYGAVNNVTVDGEFNAYFTGGIIGASYSDDMLLDANTGAGTLSADCKMNSSLLIPKEQIQYVDGEEIQNYQNIILTRRTMDYFLKVSQEFYSYKNNDEGENTLETIIIKNKVLGLIVGLGNVEDSVINKIEGSECYAIALVDGNVKFNASYTSEIADAFKNINYITEETELTLKDDVDDVKDIKCKFINFNMLTLQKQINEIVPLAEEQMSGDYYLMYFIGSRASLFDSWDNSYSAEYLIVKVDSVQN